MGEPSQAEHQQKLAAEATWVWPALCVTTLWGLGLLLNLPWLNSRVGAALLALSVVVGAIVGRVRRSVRSAASVGGAVFFGLALCGWILLLTFFRVY